MKKNTAKSRKIIEIFELSSEEENRTIVNTQNLELLSLYEHFHGEKLLSFSKVGGVVIYAV